MRYLIRLLENGDISHLVLDWQLQEETLQSLIIRLKKTYGLKGEYMARIDDYFEVHPSLKINSIYQPQEVIKLFATPPPANKIKTSELQEQKTIVANPALLRERKHFFDKLKEQSVKALNAKQNVQKRERTYSEQSSDSSQRRLKVKPAAEPRQGQKKRIQVDQPFQSMPKPHRISKQKDDEFNRLIQKNLPFRFNNSPNNEQTTKNRPVKISQDKIVPPSQNHQINRKAPLPIHTAQLESKEANEKQATNQLKQIQPSIPEKTKIEVQENESEFCSSLKDKGKHQNQYKELSPDFLLNYRVQNKECFLQPGNQIRFRINEFDPNNSIPRKSELRFGLVKKVMSADSFILTKVKCVQTNRSKPQKQIHDYQLVTLEINLWSLQKDQKSLFSTDQPGKFEVISQNKKNQKQQKPQPSKQEFAARQVNYYFSDKNYHVDKYIQMHVSNHPDKFMNVRLLLNFPKIKKLQLEESKLVSYLELFIQEGRSNFQLSPDRTLIRKRIYSTEAIQAN